ncbi:MAG: sporulation protein YtfJ [Ruminococcus sp.]|nr:sporulation protein YtfJ [Ruminococcus sp.]MBP1566809.1 GerW family sporulation protein [Oscillospiraceae bacterium]
MSKDHAVNGLMGTTIEKIREMIDVNTIIGNPITTPEGATIIPVSKVSFGFASGGSDIPSKSQKELFGGGAGAGVSVQPLAFICVSPNGDTKLLQMSVNAKKENAIINTIPELIDKISDMVSSKGKGTGKKEVKETVTEQTVVVEE